MDNKELVINAFWCQIEKAENVVVEKDHIHTRGHLNLIFSERVVKQDVKRWWGVDKGVVVGTSFDLFFKLKTESDTFIVTIRKDKEPELFEANLKRMQEFRAKKQLEKIERLKALIC